MSPLDLKFPDEIRNEILSRIILIFSTGCNVEFLRGALALAQSVIVGIGASWPEFVQAVYKAVNHDIAGLLADVVEGERA